ncbi:hypothetical protein [Rubritalea sp.]
MKPQLWLLSDEPSALFFLKVPEVEHDYVLVFRWTAFLGQSRLFLRDI